MSQYIRLFITGLLCTLVMAASSTPALAQGGGATTSLSGTVTDTSGAVIPGATVVVKDNATSTVYNATTNENGYFTVPAIDAGSYTVTVTLMGFKTAECSTAVVTTWRLSLTASVMPRIARLSDSVPQLVNTTSASVQARNAATRARASRIADAGRSPS